MANDGRCSTILVADDVAANRELFREMLEPQGYDVICAADGEEALDIIRHRPVDAALLDVVMPHRTGFDVCRAVKEDDATRLIPVVLVTGLKDHDDRIQGIQCGADDFISKPVHHQELLARVRSLVRLKQFTDELENAETVLYTLALSIEAKDPYTEGHCARLSEYSVALGKRLGLPQDTLVALRRAGIVHDIGKVAVPDNILLKPGPLTPDERRVMEQHTVVGERICTPLKSFRPVLPIIRHHHERQDGTGYPDGLRGEQIPLVARVLQTVDLFDALTTDRPYRKALPQAEALNLMRSEAERGWWDRRLIEEFAGLLAAGGSLLCEASASLLPARAAAPLSIAVAKQAVPEV